ncbi:MAG: TonB-dependent receptor [Phenylobacterium sp.]|uniref:TonB-dependent receptor domain-containing protein n=1 Tax=Phenylobacterium sp. TaxID=1871053 RepID=UPI001A53B282|nr:TonB-dependent receptor [Phenylobacterium sp.]MBL8556357.1 TonB-dependent receptor [Phenylobacterium sp.]
MTKRSYFSGGSVLAVLMSFGLAATAQAQTSASAPADVEEVVVTGSFIAGTPENSALPVDVLSAQDLEKQGSPTVVELVKTITASQSSLGESNRYNGGAGTATINLRGFGAARTLTLMNGRRLADSPAAAFQGGGANLNFIPTAAVGRIEILKDGAAATYGSDAIGGVVNFITRKDLNGLEVDGEYALINGSNGDYNANVAWGKKFENGNVLLTAGYRHRSRLDIHERGFALRPFDFAGSSGAAGFTGASNPGFYVAGATAFRDNGCEELGGTLTRTVSFVNPLAGQPNQGATVGFAVPVGPLNPATSGTGTTCRYQFSNYNDLVNREDHYQLYGEVNFDLSDSLSFHGEVAWTKDDTPAQRISPSNLTAQYPSPVSVGGTSFSPSAATGANLSVPFNVPVNNPGLLALINDCRAPLTATECAAIRAGAFSTTGAQAGAPGGARGIDIVQLGWRALSFGGNPKFKDGADHQSIVNDAFRVSGGFKGRLFDKVNFDTALTYMEQKNTANTSDILVRNLQLALRGYGSRDGVADQCTAAETANFTSGAGNAALGCYFFNPFTNAIQTSLVNGAANPYYNAAVANDPLVVAGLFGNYTNVLTNQILVADVVFSGETGIELAGGPVAWALGAQYRYARELRKYGAFFNADENPCPDRASCADETGPLQFFGSATDRDDDSNVKAIFGELQVPLLDNLNLNFAIRYEDYQGGIGSTTNPKVAIKWQALDFLALRGSASTTFRAPGSGLTGSNCNNGVRVLGSAYRAFQSCGNPDLKPEKADTYNIGAIVEFGGFTATVDYFNFKFKDEIIEESGSRLYATMFPGGLNTNCGAAAFADLQARFTFAGTCGAANVARLRSFVINGPNTKTSGLEFRAQYDWDGWYDASYTVGAEATYLIQYKRGAVKLLNSNIAIAPAEDRAGLSDILNDFFSYPELKANTFAVVSKGGLSLRWQMRYSEGTSPAFGSPFFITVPDSTATSAATACTSSACAGRRLEAVGKSKDYFQHDLIVRWQAPWDTVITASVQNLFDKDPPYLPSPYNYDLTQGNPLGRVIEVGFKKSF